MEKEAEAGMKVRREAHEIHRQGDRVVVVPLVDEHEAERIYHPRLLRWALWGALAGALLLGWLGFALATGTLALAGLGQWATAGPVAGAVTAGGIGLAVGALVGGLAALLRMPARRSPRDNS